MQSPIIRLIADNKKNISIDILATSSIALDLYKNNPNVSKVIPFDNRDAFIQISADYDFFLVAHHDSYSADLIYKIRCKILMIEYANQSTHQAVQILRFINSVFEINHDVKPLDCLYEIPTSESDHLFSEKILGSGKPYVGFHFGCHGIAKSKNWFWKMAKPNHEKAWDIKHFIVLAKTFKTHYPNSTFVLTGSSSEEKLAEQFIQSFPDSISLYGNTTIGQLKAIIENLAIFISGDTGPMHVACATTTPLIALFGNTNAIRTGPFPMTRYRKALQKDDINLITSDEVFTVARTMLLEKRWPYFGGGI